MKPWIKWVIVTVVFAVMGLLVGPWLWPRSAMIQPTPFQFPFYAFLVVLEGVLFGFAIAFALFGYSLLRKTSERRVMPAFVATVWLMVSWLPHDLLHAHIGMDLGKLLGIEYGFHLTLMIASVVVAHYLYGIIRQGAKQKDFDVKRGGFDVW